MSALKVWLALMAPAALAACNSRNETPQATNPLYGQPVGAPSGETLAAVITEDDRFAAVADALAQTGLGTVFDGPGSYSFIASPEPFPVPRESADSRAVTAKILRNHILPGSVTRSAIEDAIGKGNGTVTLRTLGTTIRRCCSSRAMVPR